MALWPCRRLPSGAGEQRALAGVWCECHETVQDPSSALGPCCQTRGPPSSHLSQGRCHYCHTHPAAHLLQVPLTPAPRCFLSPGDILFPTDPSTFMAAPPSWPVAARPVPSPRTRLLCLKPDGSNGPLEAHPAGPCVLPHDVLALVPQALRGFSSSLPAPVRCPRSHHSPRRPWGPHGDSQCLSRRSAGDSSTGHSFCRAARPAAGARRARSLSQAHRLSMSKTPRRPPFEACALPQRLRLSSALVSPSGGDPTTPPAPRGSQNDLSAVDTGAKCSESWKGPHCQP